MIDATTGDSWKSDGRVLVYCEGWGTGGIESLMMSVLGSAAFKQSGLSFDIYDVCDWNTGYDWEIARLGGRRIVSYPGEVPGLWKKFSTGISDFRRLLQSGRYSVVHVNATNGLNLIYAYIAKKEKVPVRVVQSHNSYFDKAERHGTTKALGHALGRLFFSRSATASIAVSHAAGEFVFGRRPFRVVPNGINVRRYAFDETARDDTRRALGVSSDTFLIGSLGKIEPRKNPLFQVEIFARVHKRIPNSKLLLVGNGSLEARVLGRLRELNLDKDYLHVPATSNAERYYSALDTFLMPSTSEGFGLVALEAQCSGLPVYVSEAAPSEIDATPFVSRLRLSEGSDAWAGAILDGAARRREASRADAWGLLEGTAYDAEIDARTIVETWADESGHGER